MLELTTEPGGISRGHPIFIYVRDQDNEPQVPLEAVLTSKFWFEFMPFQQATKAPGATRKIMAQQNIRPGVGKRQDFLMEYTEVLIAAKIYQLPS